MPSETSKKPPRFFESLREANLSRLPRFGHGELHDRGAWNAMGWGCAIGGECGELLNLLKKYERQMASDPPRNILLPQIGREIADVIIYLDLLAAYLGIDLQKFTAVKFNEVSYRTGFPERLDTYDGHFYLEEPEPEKVGGSGGDDGGLDSPGETGYMDRG